MAIENGTIDLLLRIAASNLPMCREANVLAASRLQGQEPYQ
jgi:hypothetical protein